MVGVLEMKYKVEVELIPTVDSGQILWAWKATAYAPGEDLIGVASAVLYSDYVQTYKVNAQEQAAGTMTQYLKAINAGDNHDSFEVEV
jgi:hypothetical protein